MTSYPGQPVPGEAVIIAFYFKNRDTGRPYDRPVSLRVLQTSTFGSNQIVYPPATHPPFDNQHKYTVTFPEDGEYITELTLQVEGQAEVIAFRLVAGNPTATRSILLAIAAGVSIFLILVRAIKVKRKRKAISTEKSASENTTSENTTSEPRGLSPRFEGRGDKPRGSLE